MGRSRRTYSLRQRYLFVTAFLSLILLGYLWLAHTYVSSHAGQHLKSSKQRNQMATTLQQLSGSLQDTAQGFERYLWAPDQAHRQAVLRNVDSVLMHLGKLDGQPWLVQHGDASFPHTIGSSVQNLRERLIEAMDKRNELRFTASANFRAENSDLIATISTIRQTVEPLFQQLLAQLHTQEGALESSVMADAKQIEHVSATVITGIWLLGIGGLGIVAISFLYFEWGVLKPIAMVAATLKAEAEGKPGEMPKAQSLESRQLIEAFTELRQQVQDRQKALENQSLRDNLTSLPNRFFWQGELNRQCEEAKQRRYSLGVLIVGLDRFKEINDTLGHAIGDRVLQLFGERLKYLLRSDDTVARLGSDEFAIMLPDSGQEEAIHIARKILEEMEHPFLIEQINLYVGCSIGVTLYPKTSNSAEELTRHASIAMYAAKRHKSGYALYDPKYDIHSVHKLSLATDLRNAIQNNDLYLVFQPQLSTADQSLHGMEVLVRWNHPLHGLVRPDEFIPIAEQTAQIHPLTTWVLENTLSHMAAWQKQQLDYGIVAINISVFNLQSTALIETLRSKLEKWQIPPEKIMLEITESAMMADPVHAKATLQQLSRLGLKLAIDDFGTGFSSLAYLKQLPVDELKIDKSFVMGMADDENDAVIVRSTIDMAHNLGLKVVAEGVENEDIRGLLEILNCDLLQGYHISKPLPAAEIVHQLPSLVSTGKIHHLKDFRER